MDCGRGDPGGAAEMIRQNNTQFSGERKRVYRDQVRQAGGGGCWLWEEEKWKRR